MQIQKIEVSLNSERPRDESRFKTVKDHYLKLQDHIYADRVEREVCTVMLCVEI